MSKAIYPSKYTDKKVTDAQYLCDEVCERIAKKEGKTLPYKYWSAPAWNKVYRRQIAEAAKLLRESDCVSIMEFLRSKEGRKIYSLGLKKAILEGVKKNNKSTVVNCEQNLNNIVVDDYVEDMPEEELDTEEVASYIYRSPWEMLQ